ncbi:MAG TPA: hypothetical protein GXX67_10005 [Petrimonas sp.]|jgi:hypothetical protein|nr:hypothetical protein [Petrimonas sp.]
MQTERFMLLLLGCSLLFIVSAWDGMAQTLPVGDLTPYVLPDPSLKKSSSSVITLKQLSVKQNEIIDEGNWFYSNELMIPLYLHPDQGTNTSRMAPYRLSSKVPLVIGDLKLIKGINDANGNIYLYGTSHLDVRYMVITDSQDSKVLHFLDFGNYLGVGKTGFDDWLMSIRWAAIEDNILYVSNTHPTYAETTNGINAFITAIDLSDYQALWRSDYLVSNAYNFEIIGDNIVCGYGFTNEPDFIYILDKYTGKKLHTIKVATGPDYIIRKDDKLYVRTYNRDYLFGIEGHR